MDKQFDKMIEEYSDMLVKMNDKKKETEPMTAPQSQQTEIPKPYQNPVNEPKKESAEINENENASENIPTAQTEIVPDNVNNSTDSENGGYAKEEYLDDVFTKEHLSVFLPLYDQPLAAATTTAEDAASSLVSTENMTGQSSFEAQVFAAQQAYPIENAKIVVRENNDIVAFLFTDENGATKQIELTSPPKRNSLNPEVGTVRAFEYTADIYADGFLPKENMLIEAVGGTKVILKVNLVPDPERVV